MSTFRLENQIYRIEAIFCPSCQCLFRDPVQVTTCGHRICRSCIDKMKSLGCHQCPVDRQQFKPEQAYEDKHFRKDLQNLKFTLSSDERISLSYDQVCQYKVWIRSVQGTCLELCLEEKDVQYATSSIQECRFEEDKTELTVLIAHECKQQRKESQLESMTRKNIQLQHELESATHKIDQLQQQLESVTQQLQHQLESVTHKNNQLLVSDRSQSALTPTNSGNTIDKWLQWNRALEECIRRANISEQKPAVLSSLARYYHVLETFHPHKEHIHQIKDGLLTWEIQDVHEKLKLSTYSPVFCTSEGYCAFLSAYLTGNDHGLPTHIAVFFYMMKSAKDCQLAWPFRHPVELTLINHKNVPDSIKQTLLPDPPVPSFQKPEEKFNVSSGFPEFAPFSILMDDRFTQNNTISLSCRILNPLDLL